MIRKKERERGREPRSIARYVAGALLILFLFLLPLYGRCLYEAYLGLIEGNEALARSEARVAVDAYARAVRWRGVLNPFSHEAIEKLNSLTQSLAGEDKIYALKELRRALFVSRSFYTNGKEDQTLIATVTGELEQLGARKKSSVVVENPFVVSYGNQLVAQMAFWGWIGSVLLLVYRGFTAEGAAVRGKRTFPLLLSVGFFVAWVVALSLG